MTVYSLFDDQRPQGFLGRAFARRVAEDIGALPDLLRWQPDDIVPGLLRHGGGSPGNCSVMVGSTTMLPGGSACPAGSAR
ncbi:hypothetical protein [Xanthomonas graminis]|uniref:hypothetical protein n=1 Tax=Xanthomonas graminis TaxID=3390026 RepID=UPI000AC03ED1|nr:hypothetical protein [Xanthomonas translucens]